MLVLTDAQGHDVFVNHAHIVMFTKLANQDLTTITLAGGGSLRVQEEPLEINQKIISQKAQILSPYKSR
jgi:uncharacterized protein YlzI (FlbEa/FlbD family)